VFSNSKLILSNETCAPHCAVALDVENLFVISNGNHYGRFVPYPKSITENYHTIFHPKIDHNQDNDDYLQSMYGSGSDLDINEISEQRVKDAIDDKLFKGD